MIAIISVVVGAIILLAVITKIFFMIEGEPRVVVHGEKRTTLELDEITETEAVLSTKLAFENVGKQLATIVDCIARPQLPYEQYDGIEVRGKAEVEGIPREDDYFEAHLIERFKTLNIVIRIRLKARKNLDLRTALSHMVDVPVDIIYTELGRSPWKVSKTRIVLTAEEIAKVAGVELVEE